MILIFPWARKTTDGKLSPKDYPEWPKVVQLLASDAPRTWQISCSGEADIGCDRRSNDLPLSRLKKLLEECETWISVDSFVPHMAWTIKQPGVVIFGSSDPDIYGHHENINLLKSRRFLRARQFGLWSQEAPNSDIFVPPEQVVASALLSIERRKLTAAGKQGI